MTPEKPMPRTEHREGDRSSSPESAPRKIPLPERLSTPEETEHYHALVERARALEEKLLALYGAMPSAEALASATGSMQEDLIAIAKDAREFARQYRHFNVGAAVVRLRLSGLYENPWAVLFDANTKINGGDRKWCAEQYLMDRAESEHVDEILSFTIVAEPQTDNDSNKPQITLTPCKICRDRMLFMTQARNPRITPDTEVITAHAEQPAFRKYQRVKDLHKFHGEYAEID